MSKTIFFILLFFHVIHLKAQSLKETSPINFNEDWEFVLANKKTITDPIKDPSLSWEKVTLPHTARIEPIEKKEEQWQGICFYRKTFKLEANASDKHIALQFDGAMQEAIIYLNGQQIAQHKGGYLPFYVDITDKVLQQKENIILVKLTNTDNASIPPGKAMKDLDFNFYGGLYRNAWLIVEDKLRISDAVEANKEAGGGVLIHYENVNESTATLIMQSELVNDYLGSVNAQIKISMKDQSGLEVASAAVETVELKARSLYKFKQELTIHSPKLWSPESPYLYTLSLKILKDGKLVGEKLLKTGIRTIRFEVGSFTLNGKKTMICGTNRHQEYPYVGYAIPDNAQYRDAYKIKLAGFNFVRCSHYPPAPAFLDACDVLGILVMNSIPGWQFFGDETFQENCYQNIRDMIHRDRNHASVILWESSLNETEMKKDFMEKSHAIVHKELPFTDVYTCGWMEGVYDVFIPARQHAKAPDYWNTYTKKPLLIAEYGDWEYYAQNAGFNQKKYGDLKPNERTSRQLRTAGEKALLQQALNYQESHNDNLVGSAVGDANWLMFDYKRGYAPDLESSGIMDITRLPKFAFYFYQSQYLNTNTNSEFGKPTVFIANYWNDPATKTVKVFSNCDEVEFLINGKSQGKQKPDTDILSGKLDHPPFTFVIDKFEAGKIEAVGYLQGKKVYSTEQASPGKIHHLRLSMDTSGKAPQKGINDLFFVRAYLEDEKGNLVVSSKNKVEFKLEGNGILTGANPVNAEAGIVTVLLRTNGETATLHLRAISTGIKEANLELIFKEKTDMINNNTSE